MRGWLAGLAVVLLTANVDAAPEPELVDLQIDGGTLATIGLVDGSEVWVPVDALCAARLCRTGDVEREGVSYVALSALVPEIAWDYDPGKGEVHVRIANDALAPTTISLGVAAPAGIEYGEATSAFVNYAMTGEIKNDRSTSFTGAFEGGLSIKGTLLYSSVSAIDERVVRGLSSVTVDDRAHLIRVIAGDALVSGGTLGGGGVVGGLHVGRDFAIDPYFAARPTLSQTGAVASPSIVEVFRDGQLVRRDIIPAGPFKIEDLAGTTSGNTRVVVRDAFGLTHAVVASATAPPQGALKPGLLVFDASVGVVRENLARSSVDYGAPAALAVVRRGFTRELTLGLRAETTPDLVSGGGGLVAGRGKVSLSLDGAVSRSARTGAASALSVGWQDARVSLAAAARLVSSTYTTLDLSLDEDRAIRAADVSAMFAVTRTMSTGVQFAAEHMRDAGDRARASVTAGMQLGRANLFFTGAAARASGLTTAEATITLSLSHGRRTTSTHSTTAASRGISSANTLSRSLGAGPDVGYQLAFRHDQASSAFADVIAQHDAGRVDVTGQWTGDTSSASIGVAGGLVAIGGRLKATRPVQGAFALVRIPDVEHVRTYVDNQPVGSTDASGDLVIPEMQAFYGNRLRVDVRDLPVDISTLTLDRIIAPPRRGGVIVKISPRPSAILRGSIKGMHNDTVIDVSYGELAIGGKRFPIGHHGAIEVEGLVAGRHRGRVSVDNHHCELTLDIPRARGIVEAPAVICDFP